ncbi:hypothetical protein SAMN06272781_3144 [Streptomyces sp. 1222.2]|nr:hypothetical protein SAMN06272781_3144 [Streptomyces sp. 1222.2]
MDERPELLPLTPACSRSARTTAPNARMLSDDSGSPPGPCAAHSTPCTIDPA